MTRSCRAAVGAGPGSASARSHKHVRAKRPEHAPGAGMIIGLTIMTAAILVKGRFGGALVYDVDHLNW